MFSTLTLGIAAGAADEAAFLIDEHAATFRALTGQVLGQAVVFKPGLAIIASGVLFQHAGNGIGAGEDGLAFFPGDGRAADAAKLPYHGSHVHSRP